MKGYIDNFNVSESLDAIPIYSYTNLPYSEINTIIVSVEGSHDQRIIHELEQKYSCVNVISWKSLNVRH
ncbi:hypothetical protein D3C73_1361480 [compost metagenome]